VHSLSSLVGKVDVVVDKNRVDGSRVRLAEVEVGDETGTVSLRARDEQIDVLKEVSERSGAVVLRNCTLELYQGRHLRLAATKWGKICPYPDNVASTPPSPSKINRDRNFSSIDLSLVASEMVVVDAYQTGEMEGPQVPQQQQPLATGRARQFPQRNLNQARGNSRRIVRSKPAGPASMPVTLLYNENTAMRYPGGLRGYGTGFEGGIDPQQYQYNVRQQERLVPTQQHQQMMMHQYEMQRRLQQHMYQPQQQQDAQTAPPSSPMLSPRSGSFDLPSQGSFDSPYGAGPPTKLYRSTQQQQGPPGTYNPASTEAQQSSIDRSPTLPQMNAQAPTFDPSHPSGDNT
jgi:hypothetical protein